MPNSDNWTNLWETQSGGGTNLWACVDDGVTSPNDSDYVHLTDDRSNKVQKFNFPATVPSGKTVTSVEVRIRQADPDGNSNGYLNEVSIKRNSDSTLLASFAAPSPPGSGFANVTLTGTVVVASGWNNGWHLYLNADANTNADYQISALDVKICYT